MEVVDYQTLKTFPAKVAGANFYCSSCTPPVNGECDPVDPTDPSNPSNIMGCGCYPPGNEGSETKPNFWCPKENVGGAKHV